MDVLSAVDSLPAPKGFQRVKLSSWASPMLPLPQARWKYCEQRILIRYPDFWVIVINRIGGSIRIKCPLSLRWAGGWGVQWRILKSTTNGKAAVFVVK
jgi:hypothetical protein